MNPNILTPVTMVHQYVTEIMKQIILELLDRTMNHPRVYFQIGKLIRTPVSKTTVVCWPCGGLSAVKSLRMVGSSSQYMQHERKKPFLIQSATSTILTENPYIFELTKEDCEEILSSKLGEKNFQIQDFTLQYFIEMLGFHGNYAGLKINCVVDDENEEFRFFVKTMANNPLIKEKYWDVLRQPYKEFVFQTEINKELQQFVQKKITAECHLGRLEEVLVLDDCCSLGYSGMTRGYLDIHHAQTAMAALANFHAASIIFEEKTCKSLLDKYGKINYESLLTEREDKPGEFLFHAVDAGVRQLGAAFFTDAIPEEMQAEFFSKIRRRIGELLQNHPKNFRKVFCHGDPVAKANMLFKYAEDGTATDCILVDFGVLRFAPPAMEVIQFLHLNSTDEFRKTNACSLKNTYYDNLTTICAQNGVDICQALPRDEFDESCEHYEEWGTCTRVYYEYVIRLPDEQLFLVVTSIDKFLDLMVYGNAELGLAAFPKNEAYRKSFTEAFESAACFYGYII